MHEIPTYKSCVIYTSNGRMVNPFDLHPLDLDPVAAYHSLSMLNRFAGNSKRPYSVAEHSWNLSYIVPDYLKRTALLHDWSEWFFNDTPSPVKRHIPGYEDLEHGVLKNIFAHFKVPFELYDFHKVWDQRILNDEAEELLPLAHSTPRHLKWWDPDKRLGVTFIENNWYLWKIKCLSRHIEFFDTQQAFYHKAEQEFLNGPQSRY